MISLLRWLRREASHVYHALHPAFHRKAAQWHQADGPAFFKALGLRAGDVVLDVGCGPGSYALPAARLAGSEGAVYAVDKNPRTARRLRRRGAALGLPQLHVAFRVEDVPAESSCRLALLYDMLHFHTPPERRQLDEAVRGRLARDGRLSVHLKHVREDEPARHFATFSARDVAAEIESAGFCLDEKLAIRLWHAHDTSDGVVWNFIKSKQPPP